MLGVCCGETLIDLVGQLAVTGGGGRYYWFPGCLGF